MKMQIYREKLLKKYGDFDIPTIKNNAQIIEYVGMYFEIQPIEITTKDVESFLNNFRKNLLLFIYQEEFSKCSTIKEILDLEKKLYENRNVNADINCFILSPNQRNHSLFDNLYKDKTEKVFILDAAQYNYLESNDSILNTIIVQQRGLDPKESIMKSDLYFAYLDILKRLDELGLL